MHAEEILPTFSMSDIYIGLCLPEALTLAQPQLYKLFRNINSVGLQGILNYPLLRDAFPYRLARAIPLKEGVP